MDLAASRGVYSADAVRQLLTWAAAPPPHLTPLDPVRYPGYQAQASPPDLAVYNQLLQPRWEVR